MAHWLHLAVATVALLSGAPAQPAREPARLDKPATGQAILNGYRRYDSACNHCHGPDGVGSTFAPSMIDQPLPFPRFQEIVEQGTASGNAVMRGFAGDPNVAPHVRDIYLYLEARAEGRGRPPLER